MECNCIKGDFNFSLEYSSCGKVFYKDFSSWMKEDYYVQPKDYELTITSPSGAVKTLNVSVINKDLLDSNLIFDTDCFEDGIYCFSVSSCGKLYKRNKAILCNLECRFANLIREASKKNDEELWNKVIKLKASLSAVYSHSELGNFDSANDEYLYLEKELNKLNCNCQ